MQTKRQQTNVHYIDKEKRKKKNKRAKTRQVVCRKVITENAGKNEKFHLNGGTFFAVQNKNVNKLKFNDVSCVSTTVARTVMVMKKALAVKFIEFQLWQTVLFHC